MKVEVVLTEADIAQEFAEAIEARDLPEKFFYWFPRSAAEWAALGEHAELYGGIVGDVEGDCGDGPGNCQTLRRAGPGDQFRIGQRSARPPADGRAQGCGRDLKYFPVDASQAMLEMACAGADDEDIETTGIKADISSPVHLMYAADAAEPPRLFIMSGNTMGSFDPLAEIRYIAQCMKPGDRLIIDGEIHDAEKTMARRDNPAARKFLSALLASVGISNRTVRSGST